MQQSPRPGFAKQGTFSRQGTANLGGGQGTLSRQGTGNLGGSARGTPSPGAAGQAATSSQSPTHLAFAQTAPAATSSGIPLPGRMGAASSQASGAPPGKAGAPAQRQGPLYGALEALSAAVNTLKESDEAIATAGALGKHTQSQAGRKGAASNLSPEQIWESIPLGGEAGWKESNSRKSQRLRVARLQEALSEAATGLQRATDACRGGPEEELVLGAAGLGPPGPPSTLRQECAVLEAEAKELEEEKAFLDARVVEVQKELRRVKDSCRQGGAPFRHQSPHESMASPQDAFPADTPEATASPARQAGYPQQVSADVNELAVVLRLLACLKDLALANRSIVLPTDPSRWTREQQVVAYFLDEVEACQSRLDTAY